MPQRHAASLPGSPEIPPTNFKRCKLLANQRFQTRFQLAMGEAVRWFESSRLDHFWTSGFHS